MEHDLRLAKRDYVIKVIVELLLKKVDILLRNKLQVVCFLRSLCFYYNVQKIFRSHIDNILGLIIS